MTENDMPKDAPRNDPPSADEDVAKLRLQLNHFTLLELEEEGLVRWDKDEHTVRKGPKFDEKKAIKNL
ncbi:hypothetical protein GS429_01580 [Natronorubrum sp. JWXQ-INN-674]|uniref:Uncharacterized protein n=1 Tax=Natronorubrum halalkaliphilum TaxID=2691917 RepID=A0A6B0VG76_9EURY|nr:hypothetical protein [Natronorubrum halalkaliphilum]MXV60781.1 hypothetical protein [Natronorubrum halalkaliphilum]